MKEIKFKIPEGFVLDETNSNDTELVYKQKHEHDLQHYVRQYVNNNPTKFTSWGVASTDPHDFSFGDACEILKLVAEDLNEDYWIMIPWTTDFCQCNEGYCISYDNRYKKYIPHCIEFEMNNLNTGVLINIPIPFIFKNKEAAQQAIDICGDIILSKIFKP